MHKNSQRSSLDYFPKDKASRYILHKRAELFSQHTIDKNQTASTDMFIQFNLGLEMYGIPYQYVKEVILQTDITSIPFLSPIIAGVINRRGSLIAIINLKQFLYRDSSVYENKNNFIILEANNVTIGILTDHIQGNDHFNPNVLDASLTTKNEKKIQYIMGIHAGKIAILHTENIIAALINELKTKKP